MSATSVLQPTGGAVLYVTSTVAPEAVEDFTRWCDSIHHHDTMRVDGFISLRRFDLVEGVARPDRVHHRLLTLYQVRSAGDADFTTESYARHTATYTQPPSSVEGNVAFERQIYERTEPGDGGEQPVGEACITLTAPRGFSTDAAASLAATADGFLNAYQVRSDDEVVLIVDCESVGAAAALYRQLQDRSSLEEIYSLGLFRQSFPRAGVLLRDQVIRSH